MHSFTKTLIGAALFAMGLVVMSGWLLHIPLMVQFRIGFVPMVFNTAFCFFVTGLALVLPGLTGKLLPGFQAAAGTILVLVCGASFCEIVLDINLGIDWPNLHIWIGDGNMQPGRMAPNTALGFILIGVAFMVVPGVNTRRQAVCARLLTFCVLAVGLTGLVGYLLAPDLLYGWARSARMAVHTATGMILAGIALWLSWANAEWYHSRRFFDEEEKIAFMSRALLVVLTVTAGLVGFGFQQVLVEKALRQQLGSIYADRAGQFYKVLDESVQRAQSVAANDDFIQLARKLVQHQSGLDVSNKLTLPQHAQSLIFSDPQGNRLLELGSAAINPGVESTLKAAVPVQLLWSNDSGLRLRISFRVVDGEQFLGDLRIEESIADLQRKLFDKQSLGQTGEILVCLDRVQMLLCLPKEPSAQPYSIKPLSKYGKPLPMKLALDGQAGVMEAVDYQGHNVMAAFDRLAPGLAMVAKQDTVELYADIRGQLKIVFPLLVLLAIFGSIVMGSQLRPLARRLINSEAEAADAEQEISTLLRSVGEGILTINEAGIIESFNPAASQIFGYPAEAVIGQNLEMLMPPAMRQAHRHGFAHYLAGGNPQVIGKSSVELPGLRSDGSIFQLELSVNEMRINHHRQFVGIIRDITERKLAESALFAEKERLRVTLSSIGDAVITTDTRGHVTYLNPIAETMTGWTAAEACGLPIHQVFEIIDEKTGKLAFNPIHTVLQTKTISGLDADTTLIQRNTGHQFPIEDSAAPIRGPNGEIIGVVLVFHDVTETRRMAAEMTYQATHDSLTGLINRREFERRVELALQTGKMEHKEHSLLYLDLDQFKIVNDTCGHVAGDELL